jgi:hypothetical protein
MIGSNLTPLFLLFLLATSVWADDKAIKSACVDEKQILHREFIEAHFDEGRMSVGKDQIEPIKEKIASFIKEHSEMLITDVLVVVSSSKTPFYKTENGKKKLDPQSDKKNLNIAKERAAFSESVLSELKASSTRYQKIIFTSRAELSGPDFSPLDLNERFVTKMTPGYLEKLAANYKNNHKLYSEQAFVLDYLDLMDEKKYVNLYQAKFKPFHGFRIEIKGHVKDKMKCVDSSKKSETEKSSKQ